jgi:hypothetical protein
MISAATWFETRGVDALLTVRVSDLILRSIAKRCVSKDEAIALENVFASAGIRSMDATWQR